MQDRASGFIESGDKDRPGRRGQWGGAPSLTVGLGGRPQAGLGRWREILREFWEETLTVSDREVGGENEQEGGIQSWWRR